MRRSLYSVVAGALLIGATAHAGAQDAAAPVVAGGSAEFATVIGISNGDLLNIRAAASATGMTIARVPNGTLLKLFGCDTVNGNLWCKVEDAANAGAFGWTPARYLSGYEDRAIEAASGGASASVDETSIMSTDKTFGVETTKDKPDARARGVVASFYTEPLSQAAPTGPADPSAHAVRDARRSNAAAKTGDGGAARLAAGPRPPASGDEPVLMAAPFVALPVVGAGGSQVADAPAENISDADDGADGVALPKVAVVPEPSPIPAPAAGQAADEAAASADVASPAGVPKTDRVAPAVAAPTGERTAALDAARIEGQIPCARYLGQPMTACRAGVVRESTGNAVVTVDWPDGGQRVIRFRDGRVEGSDSPLAFEAMREANLNIIRIGGTERFEIPDTLAFGG